MFYDWLKTYQDFDYQLPLIGKRHCIEIDSLTGEELGIKQPTVVHEGSYSTTVRIRISGNRLIVDGNPSRIDRCENLFGYSTLEQGMDKYNDILHDYGLPQFTKATRTWYGVGEDGSRVHKFCDGAVFQEIHITSNRAIGMANEDVYLRALSMLPYRNMIPRLHTNSKTVDWLNSKGEGAWIYPSVYNKSYELALHALPTIKRRFGVDSSEYQYLLNVINYCKTMGVVRFEQKLKSDFLRKHDLNHYGLVDESVFKTLHEEFLTLDQKMQVEAMNLESISEQLMRQHICENTKAANMTTIYAIQWMHGQQFDFNKSQVKTHRARLRKIGIDIALPCDLTKFSLVNVRDTRTIEIKNLPIPDWYQRPKTNFLSVVR